MLVIVHLGIVLVTCGTSVVPQLTPRCPIGRAPRKNESGEEAHVSCRSVIVNGSEYDKLSKRSKLHLPCRSRATGPSEGGAVKTKTVHVWATSTWCSSETTTGAEVGARGTLTCLPRVSVYNVSRVPRRAGVLTNHAPLSA